MKKSLILVATLLFSVSAAAEEWILLDETENGHSRLFGKTGSLDVSPNKSGILVAAATFAITSGGSRETFAGAVTIKSCTEGNGEVVVGNGRIPPTKYWWSTGGERFYDTVAKSLCNAAEAAAKASKPSLSI